MRFFLLQLLSHTSCSVLALKHDLEVIVQHCRRVAVYPTINDKLYFAWISWLPAIMSALSHQAATVLCLPKTVNQQLADPICLWATRCSFHFLHQSLGWGIWVPPDTGWFMVCCLHHVLSRRDKVSAKHVREECVCLAKQTISVKEWCDQRRDTV